MKKIYMILAAITLLSMSLNAQTTKSSKRGAVQPAAPTEKVVTPPDGYFRMGPSRVSTTPVTPPYSNSFDSFDWWEAIDNNGDSYTWVLYSNAARIRWNSSRAADDWLVTAPITLQAGRTYKFYIDTWAESGSRYPERLEVKLASTNTATALSAGTSIIGQTTVTASSSSPQHLSNENITVSTSGNYYIGIHGISDANMYYLYVDNFVIDVEAEPEHDLGIALSAPASVGAGNTATVTATVTNAGGYAETGYTVSFFADGTLISTQTGGALATGASATFNVDYATTAAQAGTTVNFTATVTCNDDANATNNNAAASMSVFTLPAPENVVATPNNDNQSATVTWAAPSNLPTITVTETVTEGFDDTSVFPPYSVGGISATQHTGAFGDWTLYDPSGANVFGDQDLTWENEGAPHAWQVFPASTFEMDAHSGDQFMLSIDCVTSGGNTNHWLISPELSGNAQTISFYVAEITTSYGPETYEIWISSTDNDPSSFTQLGNSYSINSTSWTPQSVSLPAGTKYFAIRHTAYDIYGMMIDDVTYEITREAPLAPVSYNIYLDGQLVGNVDANDPLTYDFGTLASGDHECAVSAVYTLGESTQVPANFTIEPKTATPTLSMVDNGDGTYTITATATSPDTDAEVTLNVTGQQPVTGTGSASITIIQTNADQPVTATATAQATDKLVSNEATENFIVPALPITPTPSITYVVNGDNVVITATGQGEVTLNITGQDPVTGNGTVSITLPRTDENYTVTATATAQAAYHQQSATATEQITIPFLQTSTPTITYTTQGENVIITATATAPDADAEVTLTVGNGEPVIGTGSVSVTVPCGVTSTTVTATATAKVDGKAQSETATEQVPIPAGEGWIEMYGTYDNPGDYLSLESLEVDDEGNQKEIMLVDQFIASTLYNDHTDKYTYTMRETIDNEEKSSNAVNIPVYKTNSTMQGFYTQGQVDTADLKMELKPQIINSAMYYDVHPEHSTLYYSLYRGLSAENENYPVIDEAHRVSQLQKYEEMVGENNVQYFMFENHQKGVTPRYDHLGNGIAERIDTAYVQGVYNDEIAYVPVIWTYGLYTGRDKGDGKNNSYGSDIKREKLGKTEIVQISGSYSGGNNQENTGNGWEGYFYKDGVQYYIFTPVITIEGTTPEKYIQHDRDTSVYVPYMYRAWCLYDGAIDFGHNSEGVLVGGDPIQAPFLLGQELVTDPNVNRMTIGKDWNGGPRLQNSFAVPRSIQGADLQFAVRFYYKKVVTQAQAQAPNSLRGNRDGNDEEEEYYIVEDTGNGNSIPVMIEEFLAGKTVTGVTYVNSLGMQSDKPFDGLNIIVTRYSDGTTSTTKVMR